MAFCQTCGCVADDDEVWCDECLPEELAKIARHDEAKKEEPVDCAFPCNGACRVCGQPVVYVTMLPLDGWDEAVAMNPEFEHGGNIEIRPNKAGKLFGKETGPDPDQKKFIMHRLACVQRRPHSKADAMMPQEPQVTRREESPHRPKTWPEERAEMIQEALRKLQ